nr:[citrate (pro-3S)-lyase] ligase [Levilactobacillus suantsaiihabitans]
MNLTDVAVFKEWREFLESLGITNFQENELQQIDTTLGMYNEQGSLIATGSVAGNVLKYVGVCNKFSTQGSHFNSIVSALMNLLAQRGIFHLFVFTKVKYSASFQHVGFHELAQTDLGAILETGDTDVNDYVRRVEKVATERRLLPAKRVGAIVMNANPFTLGHRYLVEQAAQENELVYVFVVSDDVSLFTTAERLALVKQGTQDLKNVVVVTGDQYMVSYVTFPAYFLPTADEAIQFQTTLDARLFRDQIAPALQIQTRYLGSEPISRTTGIYNQVLQAELPPSVDVKVISRLTHGDQVITATRVRQAIAENQAASVLDWLPANTADFIQQNLATLQARIQKGMNINGN